MSEKSTKPDITKRIQISCPTIEEYSIPTGDFESTYEESFNQLHVYHKTWDCNRELCKVTEYNESLEYSITDEAIDLPEKAIGKITPSIIEKFPRFSVASLCMSELSGQAVSDNRKSIIDYKEEVKQDEIAETLIETEDVFCSCSSCKVW